jgi:ABC-type transport system substrate-binding protein
VRDRRWSFRLLAALLGLTLLAAACGDDGDDTGAESQRSGKKDEGTAVTGEGLPEDTLIDYTTLSADNPNHIDPATADTRQGSQVTELIYDSLTEVNSDDELVGAVAEEWESNDDATVWTFTLKDDVTFSNGDPVTPTDFKRSWERVLDPDLASEINYHFLPIQGAAEVIDGTATELTGVVPDDDANTLEVRLTDPLSDWPDIVSHTVFSPVPREAYEAEDFTRWERGVMIGNGPYKMSEPWEQNVEINLEINDTFYGTAAQIPKISFKISKDVEASYAAFEAGEGDTGYIPPGQFAAATEAYNNNTDGTLGSYYFGIGWDNESVGGPDNLIVRRAISLAIDRDRINEQVYDGSRRNATGFTPPGIPGFTEDLCEYCSYDPDEAQRLIDEWGKADTMEPLQINFNQGGGHEEVVNIVAENLEAVGLRVEQDGRDGETYFSEIRKAGACGLCRAGWIWDYVSYYSGMNSVFTTSGIDGDNLGRTSIPEFDEKVAEASRELDEDRAAELWVEAERILLDNMAGVPINWYNNQTVYSDRVQNFKQNALQSINYPELELAN